MYAMMVDEDYIKAQKAEGMDIDALLDPSIIAHNTAIENLPADLTVAMHLCRGNIPKGQLAAVGGWQDMANTLFQKMNYKRFALEYDNSEVTGDFLPLQHLPSDKLVVLGIVTTKDAELEEINDLKAQVYEAADTVAKVGGFRLRSGVPYSDERTPRSWTDYAIGPREDSRASVKGEPSSESILRFLFSTSN